MQREKENKVSGSYKTKEAGEKHGKTWKISEINVTNVKINK